MQYRSLGSTGLQVSALAFGGYVEALFAPVRGIGWPVGCPKNADPVGIPRAHR